MLQFEDTLTKRKYTSDFTPSKFKKFQNDNLGDIFKPLEHFLNAQISPEIRSGETEVHVDDDVSSEESDTYERFFQVGTKVKVLWDKDSVADLGWRGGWYVAYVTDHCRDEDQISVQHVSERTQIYTIEVTPALAAQEIKLA